MEHTPPDRQSEYSQTDQNRVRQSSKQGHYDAATVDAILDAGIVAHVAIVQDGQPIVIPMFYVRLDNQLVFHGSTKSRLMRYLASGGAVSVSVALVDGWVLARSIFHHSMNYRSVVVHGRGSEIQDPQQREKIISMIADRVMPGRSQEARWPSPQEDKATLFVGLEIESASAKVRAGGPVDDPQDLELDVWAGVLPLQLKAGPPEPDGDCGPIPESIRRWQQKQDSSS